MVAKNFEIDYDDICDVLYVYTLPKKKSVSEFTTEIWKSSLIALRRDRLTRKPIGFIINNFESFYSKGKFTSTFFPRPFRGSVYKMILDKVKEEMSANQAES